MEVNFRITNKMVGQAERVGSFKKACELFNLEPSWEKKLQHESMVRRLMNSTTSKVARGVVEKILDLEPARDEGAGLIIKQLGLHTDESTVQEIVNCRNANTYIEQIVSMNSKSGDRLDLEKELLNIHSLVGERMIAASGLGVYRNVAMDGEMAPPAVELPYQMESFIGFLSDEKMYPLFKLAVIFYELLRLKPFVYGNRQTGYIFFRMMMFVLGMDERRLLSLEEGLERDRGELMEFMQAGNDVGDITGFVEALGDIVVEEMDKLSDKLKKLSVGESKRGQGRQVALSNRQIELIEELEIRQELTMAGARKLLPEVSDDTILRDLKDLVEKQVVVKKGRTKGARYLLGK